MMEGVAMNDKSRMIVGGMVGFLVLGAMGLGIRSWFSRGDITKVEKLVDQLYAAGDLPQEERNALKLDLMRTVDELPGEQVQELYRQLGEKGAEYERKKIEEFASATELDKAALLDADLQRIRNQGEVWRALRSDGVPYSAWHRPESDDRGKEDAAGEAKEPLSEEERAAIVEFKQKQGEYYAALKARAAANGMNWGERDGKSKRKK